MRLTILQRGHRLRQRVALFAIWLVGRTEPDPVAKLSLYRPEFFGRSWVRLIESTMRGPSEWSDADRELMGAFVSRINECPFCVGIHEGTAALLTGSSSIAEQLERWREPDFDPRLGATLGLLEKVTIAPDRVSATDVAAVRAAGVSPPAIADALYICFLFNTVNRLANAFDFAWATEADRVKLARGLNRIRYHIPEFLLT